MGASTGTAGAVFGSTAADVEGCVSGAAWTAVLAGCGVAVGATAGAFGTAVTGSGAEEGAASVVDGSEGPLLASGCSLTRPDGDSPAPSYPLWRTSDLISETSSRVSS